MRLHIVNGTQELIRAQGSTRPSRGSTREVGCKATSAFLSSLVSLLEDPREDVTHIAVAIDNPARSFRNDLLPGYRVAAGMSPDVAAQLPMAMAAARALGIKVWALGGYEANDALAAVASRWSSEVAQVRLLCLDPVIAQCVQGDRVVQVNQSLRRVTTESEVFVRYGCRPEAIPDWLALVGDPGHGIPGVPQFGPRSAGALLERFGALERIPADGDLWNVTKRHTNRLATALRPRRGVAALYKRLATLAADMPVDCGLEDLRWRGADADQLAALRRDHGLVATPPRGWRRF